MLLDFARLQGTPEDQIRKLQQALARAKTVDDGITEFRRFRENFEKKSTRTMDDSNGRYLVAKTEKEMIQRLHNGWN